MRLHERSEMYKMEVALFKLFFSTSDCHVSCEPFQAGFFLTQLQINSPGLKKTVKNALKTHHDFFIMKMLSQNS